MIMRCSENISFNWIILFYLLNFQYFEYQTFYNEIIESLINFVSYFKNMPSQCSKHIDERKQFAIIETNSNSLNIVDTLVETN